MVYIFSKDLIVLIIYAHTALTYFVVPSFDETFKPFKSFCGVSINRIPNFWSKRSKTFCAKFIIIWSGHNKIILGLRSFRPWRISFFERNFSYTVAWIQANFCSTYFCINVSLVGLFAGVSSFYLCFGFTGINFRGMLFCAYYENNCEPIRTRKCRITNWLINYI